MNNPELKNAGASPESSATAAIRLLKVAAFTIGGFIAVSVGVVFLIDGFVSSKPASVAVGILLLGAVAVWVCRIMMRSRRMVVGAATDKTMICKQCGAFPTTSLELARPTGRQSVIWGIVGTVCLAGAAIGIYVGEKYIFVVPAAFLGLWGFNAWRIAVSKTERCPKCHSEAVARSTSESGRHFLAQHGQ